MHDALASSTTLGRWREQSMQSLFTVRKSPNHVSNTRTARASFWPLTLLSSQGHRAHACHTPYARLVCATANSAPADHARARPTTLRQKFTIARPRQNHSPESRWAGAPSVSPRARIKILKEFIWLSANLPTPTPTNVSPLPDFAASKVKRDIN